MPDAPWAGRRVALVHDWLTGMRGGERVLESLCRIFPGAPIHTLVHVPGSVSPAIESHPIHASIVQALPWPARLYRHYLPLFPTAVECFDLDAADLVISTSHCAAKAAVAGGAPHLCYCHSPMRYVWDQFPHYFGPERVGPAAGLALRPILAWLARWDRETAPRVDRFVANSRHVAGRIGRYYNRPATVLYPPVDTTFFTPGDGRPGTYCLVVSALVPYKRVDLAIRAAALAGVPLRVVGDGPDRARLEALAGPSVEFCGPLDADALRAAYRGARVFVLPGEEDFGIAAVEAMACGRPVVALGRGGAAETVAHGRTGLLVDDPSPRAFARALEEVSALDTDVSVIRARADIYSVDHFESGFRALVTEFLASTPAC